MKFKNLTIGGVSACFALGFFEEVIKLDKDNVLTRNIITIQSSSNVGTV
jgi:hypothetical protein